MKERRRRKVNFNLVAVMPHSLLVRKSGYGDGNSKGDDNSDGDGNGDSDSDYCKVL